MRVILVTVAVAVLFSQPATALAADEVTVLELVQLSEELAGAEVVVEGELVGDYGFRSDGWMWTQLNGDIYVTEPLSEAGSPSGGNIGVGIRMPVGLGETLDPPGRYRHRGPVVRVTGTWKYHDPERQGESYLEVESLVVVERGRPLEEPVNWLTVAIGTLLIAAAGAMWVSWRSQEA